jgi:hypothetical protein
MKTTEERFEEKVDRSGACHLWTAAKTLDGYGQVRVNCLLQLAHRRAWEVANGPIPDGLQVLHRCDVRACVRVEHLFLGTNDDNVRDKVEKGRHAFGRRNGRAKLTPATVRTIRFRLANGEPAKLLSEEFGVHAVTIYAVKTRRAWKHIA